MTARSMEKLLADGCALRMAQEYADIMEAERAGKLFATDYMNWAHEHGFFAESACAYNLDESNLDNYLSDYDFQRLWPLDDWQRIWINDKLTLGYMLAGTKLERYLPQYYYYTSATRLIPLFSSSQRLGHEAFLDCLRKQGSFACKPCNGSQAQGFHTLSYGKNGLAIDGCLASEQDVIQFVESHRNYVFTEFLRPCAELAAIDPLIHTLRVIVANPDGMSPQPLATYLRFATDGAASKTGANYEPPTSEEICSYNVYVNPQTGRYGQGKLVYANRVVDSPNHPSSNVRAEGVIPGWNKVQTMLRDVSLALTPLEYLGFDVGITEDGPKIMEINSHPGVKYVQLFRPIFKDPVAGPYFRARLDAIDSLSADEKRLRNSIAR